MTARWRILMCVFFAAAQARIAEADERPITSLVPADCIVVYTARPYSDWKQGKASSEEASAGGSHLSAILTLLNASGLIPREGSVMTLRIVAGLMSSPESRDSVFDPTGWPSRI